MSALTITLKAHRLIKLAGEQGLSEAMVERLYRAYFTEGQVLFDDSVLMRLAVEVGLDAATVTAFLASDQYADGVKADQDFITGRGANGVPFFVFNNKYALSGAQPPEAFVQTLEAVWEEIPQTVAADGAICDPDTGVCEA
jgi:predicted DsbA family dithiol-disulfide isomerase